MIPDFNPTATEVLFWNALALIVVSCCFAPLFVLVRLGSILGYLAAGLMVQLIYPGSLTAHPEELLHFAEFGVVLFLFVIGLELHPSELWRMRRDIFGLGGAQMVLCGALLAGLAWLFGNALDPSLTLSAAIVVGARARAVFHGAGHAESG